jgi:hypothetical protein
MDLDGSETYCAARGIIASGGSSNKRRKNAFAARTCNWSVTTIAEAITCCTCSNAHVYALLEMNLVSASELRCQLSIAGPTGPALARPVVRTIQNRHRSHHVALFQPDADTRFISKSALTRPSFQGQSSPRTPLRGCQTVCGDIPEAGVPHLTQFSNNLARVDVGEVVILASNRFHKLLTSFRGNRQYLDQTW